MKVVSSHNIIEPFFIDFDIYFTDDPKSLAKKLIKSNPDPAIVNELTNDWIKDESAGASISAGMMGIKKDTYGIIAVFDIRVIKEHTYAYFSHESIHVMSHCLMWTGAKYDPNNDEWPAYLVDHIFRMITETYNKVK